MTLFAALGEKSTAQSSFCSPPTAIQLHSHHALDFVANKISNESSEATADAQTAKKYRHSILSYQAIQTHQDEEERTHNKPDLGIWNCSLNNEFDDASLGAMLKNVILLNGGQTLTREGQEEEKKDAIGENESYSESAKDATTNTVIMTVSLEELDKVHPTLERMRKIVVDAYQEITITGKGTTPIKTLESCSFGKCQIKQEVVPKSGGISLVLAVIVPSSKQQGNASTEYHERQKQSLVVYHLHKFALEVNCTLCFVKEDNDATKEGDTRSISTMTVEAMAVIMRHLAMNLPPLENSTMSSRESSEELTESNDEQKESTDEKLLETEPSIYPPDSHDVELISGVMQRNASCEGSWDASKDDLDKALPSIQKTPIDSNEGSTSKVGDEEWLSRLASSVGIAMDKTKVTSTADATEEGKVPVEKKKEATKKKKSSKSAASSKSEKAPSDFFANLLKK